MPIPPQSKFGEAEKRAGEGKPISPFFVKRVKKRKLPEYTRAQVDSYLYARNARLVGTFSMDPRTKIPLCSDKRGLLRAEVYFAEDGTYAYIIVVRRLNGKYRIYESRYRPPVCEEKEK